MVIYSSLSQPIPELGSGDQNMVTTPHLPPPFDLGSPKLIGYIPLTVTIIVEIYSSSAQAVSELECRTKIWVEPPFFPPPFCPTALKNNRAHLQTIVILCAENRLSSIFNFSVIARTRNFRGGLVFIPPFLKESVYWVRTSLNTTLLAICISHVNVISMKGCYHSEKAVTDGRTSGTSS